MSKPQATFLLSVALVILLALLVFTSMWTIRLTSQEGSAQITLVSSAAPADAPALKQGLITESGHTYFYNQDGTLFTDGYKELTTDGQTRVYYFLPNGQAFTSGYKAVNLPDGTGYFFFQEDGTAFTGGYKELSFGDETYLYFFAEDGRAIAAQWMDTPEGRRYFDEAGRALKDTFLTLEDKTYRFTEDATLLVSSWFCLEGEEAYRYAGEDGTLATNTVVEGYRLDDAGKSRTKYRIIQYVNKHTDPSMTNEEKIQALYDWILHSNMCYIRSYEHVRSNWRWKDSWVDDMAASHMDNWGGNCYRYAAFSGMLLREATGLPVRVYHGSTYTSKGALTPHSWCAVYQDDGWYIYDVELQKFTDYARYQCFKLPENESFQHVSGVATDLYS